MSFPIEVRKIRKRGMGGRGVFALKNFSAGEIIERCPILHLTPRERRLCEKTLLNYYIYPWKNLRDAAVIMGYGFIYNHSYQPNAKWKPNLKTSEMVYRAIKPIKKDEEILIDYNGDYGGDEIDWFEVED